LENIFIYFLFDLCRIQIFDLYFKLALGFGDGTGGQEVELAPPAPPPGPLGHPYSVFFDFLRKIVCLVSFKVFFRQRVYFCPPPMALGTPCIGATEL